MNLKDALHKEFAGLDGRDDPMLQDAAGAISCRLLVGFLSYASPGSSRADPPKFPGYPDNGSSCQVRPAYRLYCHMLTTRLKIHALNWTRNRVPIQRSKLAHEVAKKVDRYLNHMDVRLYRNETGFTVTHDPLAEDCSGRVRRRSVEDRRGVHENR